MTYFLSNVFSLARASFTARKSIAGLTNPFPLRRSVLSILSPLLSPVLLAMAAPAALASIGNLVVSNDAATVSYQYTFSTTAPERQLYLDTDQKASTGYAVGTLGAEYLVINGNLYKYTGTGGYNWSWKLQRTVSYSEIGGVAKWTIARSELNFPTSVKAIGKLSSPLEVNLATTQTLMNSLAPLARDPYKWPFASNSIWNMPIGKGAQYVPARLPAVPSNNIWAPMPQLDLERIILRPEALKTKIAYNGTGWTPNGNRCTPTTTILATLPLPNDYLVPNSMYNNGAAIVEADGRTLTQTQPLARCAVGSSATALGTFPPLDLYGDGIAGAHGGSGLSTLGGTLRVGELRPNGQPPRHALKLDVDSMEVLYPCKVQSECFRWPAKSADTGAVGYYGKKNVSPNLAMKMGSLLAIPASVDITKLAMETAPGKQLAWTLQNYGIYIVDTTGGPGYAISVEDGVDGSFAAQFQKDWTFPMEQRAKDNTPWTRDFQRLITLLQVVNNNSPTSIGGGGTPLQTLAPALP
jgi:hypothetical protein